MMNGPCARLTIFMMPHTSEKPSATSARIPLSSKAFTTICPSSTLLITPPLQIADCRLQIGLNQSTIGCPLGESAILALVPRRHWVERFLLGHVGGKDGVLLTVGLELLDRHRLVDVDAAIV